MPKERHIRVRAERRSQPDLRKLSKALLALAQAQAEKDAAATYESETAEKCEDQGSGGPA